jgi:hypothetical protein
MTASGQTQEGRSAVDKALSWYGWGSPIGLSLGIGVAAVGLRLNLSPASGRLVLTVQTGWFVMTAPYRSQSFTIGATPGHVLIIGGGIGGLCLAQGLQKAGISRAVYEREHSVADRLQGYRVHISPTGSRALHECLPPRLFDAFARTCGTGNGGAHFYTERMGTLMTVEAGDIAYADPITCHRSASRITFRQVLMSGLENLHFGKAFMRYETDGGRVVAHFEDGSWAEGDVLVAADGGGSRVRRQFLPEVERVDTGVVAIGAKIFLDEAREKIDLRFLDGISLVATRGVGLFVAPQEFDGPPIDGIGDNTGVPREAGNIFDNTRSYLMWGLSGRPASLGLSGRSKSSTAPRCSISRRGP